MAISRETTVIDYLLPSRASRSMSLLKDALLVISFSVLLALCAQVSFHIPTTPIPITLQTLGVLLTGAALGSKRGSLAMLAYLAEGAAGFPVFAGGTGGFLQLVGFTAGYLWSYPIAAFAVGFLCERGWGRSFQSSALAMLVGSLVIYAIGFPWFAVVLHLSLYTGFMGGVVPFILGDLIKLVIAATLLPTTWAIVQKVKPEK